MKRIIIVPIFLLFVCCSGFNKQNQNSGKTNSDTFSTSISNTNQTNCVRGAAEPIVKKTVYPQSTFVLQPDSLTGIETVVLSNGDVLTIKNWGCEYYILTFRFETTRFQANPSDLVLWFKQSALLMNEVSEGLQAPINIKKGTEKLLARIESNQPLKLKEEVDFGVGDIRSFVSVDKVEKIGDKKYAVEISFSTGPL